MPRPLRAFFVLAIAAYLVTFGVTVFGGSGTQGFFSEWQLGGDFLPFWTGGALVADGRGHEVYSKRAVSTRQEDFAKSPMRYSSAYPPPLYNAMALPQGAPYAPAARTYQFLLALLFFAGAALWASALPELGDWRRPFALALALSPSAFIAMMAGQLAGLWVFLTAAGVWLIRRGKPLQGGLVLGLLCAKPSLGLPVAGMLFLTGNARAFAGFAGGGAALLGASLALHGPAPWVAFFEWIGGGGLGKWSPAPDRHLTVRALLTYPFRRGDLEPTMKIVAFLVALGGVAATVRPAFRLDPADPRWPLRAGLVLAALLLALPYMMGYDAGMHALAVGGCLIALRGAGVERPKLGAALLIALFWCPVLFPASRFLQFSLGSVVAIAWFLWARIDAVDQSPYTYR